MDVKKDFLALFALLFSSKEGAMLKAFKILLFFWFLCTSGADLVQKEAPSTTPSPQTVKKQEKICQRPSCWLPRCLWGLLLWIPMSGSFSCCAALPANICWDHSGGTAAFFFNFFFGQAQPMDTWNGISSASLTLPGFALLCYHRDPFPCCSNRKS